MTDDTARTDMPEAKVIRTTGACRTGGVASSPWRRFPAFPGRRLLAVACDEMPAEPITTAPSADPRLQSNVAGLTGNIASHGPATVRVDTDRGRMLDIGARRR